MLVVGVVLLVVAAVSVLVALYQRGRWYLMAVTETLSCGQLRDQVATAGELGGTAGGFSQVCEVVGAAQSGPDGPLTAKMSQVECVWHRHVVRRQYWEQSSDGKGGQRRQKRTELVSEFTSGAPFTVVDETGSILVVPDGTTIDRPERVAKEFTPASAGPTLTALGVTVNLGTGGGTVGFEHEEWVIRPGTQLYVLGEVTAPGGELRMGKPATGKYIISTRTEAELTATARRIQRVCMAIAAVSAAAGAALLVAAAVS